MEAEPSFNTLIFSISSEFRFWNDSEFNTGTPSTIINGLPPLTDVRPRIWKFKPSLPGREEERVTTKPGVAPCRAAPTLVMARLSNTWLPICSTAPVNVAFFCVP